MPPWQELRCLSYLKIAEQLIDTVACVVDTRIGLTMRVRFNHIISKTPKRARHRRCVAPVDAQRHLDSAVFRTLPEHIEIEHVSVAILHRTAYRRCKIVFWLAGYHQRRCVGLRREIYVFVKFQLSNLVIFKK